jgi:hypothetical protein
MQAVNHHGSEAIRLFRDANTKFIEAVRANASSALTYFKWGHMLYMLTKLNNFFNSVCHILNMSIRHLENVCLLSRFILLFDIVGFTVKKKLLRGFFLAWSGVDSLCH